MSVPYVFDFSPGNPPQYPIAVEVPFSRIGEKFFDWFEIFEDPAGSIIKDPTGKSKVGHFFYKYSSARAHVLLFRMPQMAYPFAQSLQVCFKAADKSAAVHAAIRIKGVD